MRKKKCKKVAEFLKNAYLCKRDAANALNVQRHNA